MKDYLKKALEYRRKNMLPSDVTEEVMLDDMDLEEATNLWMALIAVYGCRDIKRCMKFHRGKYISLDFSDLFDYATDRDNYNFDTLSEQFDELVNSEEFEEILKDPVILIN